MGARLAGLAFLGVLCRRASLQRFLASCHSWASVLTTTLHSAGTEPRCSDMSPADGAKEGPPQGSRKEKRGPRSGSQERNLESGEGLARDGAGAWAGGDEGGAGAAEAEGRGDPSGVPGVSPRASILRAAAFAALTDLVTR